MTLYTYFHSDNVIYIHCVLDVDAYVHVHVHVSGSFVAHIGGSVLELIFECVNVRATERNIYGKCGQSMLVLCFQCAFMSLLWCRFCLIYICTIIILNMKCVIFDVRAYGVFVWKIGHTLIWYLCSTMPK